MSIKVTLIGAGNVGTHLGKRFQEVSVEVVQVFSRKKTKANKLAKLIGAAPVSDLKDINNKADLYIIAVHDDAISEVAKTLSRKKSLSKKLVVHTSGATSSEALKQHFANFGIFYPLQTFSIDREVDFNTIPVCVFSTQKKNLKTLSQLAVQISDVVHELTDAQRASLHVAAVYVNNFSNHLFHIAATICEKENLPFDILKPLIQETVVKIQDAPPAKMQTGPAQREDYDTLVKHLNFLENYPEFSEVYEVMTKSLLKKRNLLR